MEALGNGQTVAQDAFIAFDPDSVDSVGQNIILDSSGTVFTINRTGLYFIQWDINLAPFSTSAVVGIIEDGGIVSGASASAAGNLSSGSAIYVGTVPFTISLYNFDNEITLENPFQWADSAASIRIIRFADGPSA